MRLTMATEKETKNFSVVAKESGDAIDISRCFDKKNETKRAGIASAVDLRRPKTRWRQRNGDNHWMTMAKEKEEENSSVVAKESGDAIDISRWFDKRNEKQQLCLVSLEDDDIESVEDLSCPTTRYRRRNGPGTRYSPELVFGAPKERQHKKKNTSVAKLGGTAIIKPRTFANQSEQENVDLRRPKARQREQGQGDPVVLPRFRNLFEPRPLASPDVLANAATQFQSSNPVFHHLTPPSDGIVVGSPMEIRQPKRYVGTVGPLVGANNIKSQTFSNAPAVKRVGTAPDVDLRRPKARHRAHDESEGGGPPRASQESSSSWSAIASVSAGTRPHPRRSWMTTAEKISRFQQVNMDGLDGTCAIFEVRFSILFLEGSQKDLMANWLEHIRKSLAAVLRSDLGLRILPIRDDAYKEVQRWIRSESDLRLRMATVDDFAKFLDLDFGNGKFFLKSTQSGPRTLRSRIRVGYDIGLEREAVRRCLHSHWAYQATSGGCFDSPLQYGNMVRIGALYFYPEGLDVTTMEKELMRQFNFEYPIGLGVDWVNQPYDGNNKRTGAKGIRLYHLYTRTEDAKIVDAGCSRWLSPDTATNLLPWATPAHYISDWKSSQLGLTSVSANGSLKQEITRMVRTCIVARQMTEVLWPDVDILGMLQKMDTELFGSLTLLRLLMSIKVTPAQATAARQANLLSSYAKVEGVAEWRRHQDLLNHNPSPLFVTIMPGKGRNGTYLFVVRCKYAALARNVLRGLVPFLRHHLQMSYSSRSDKILKRWISNEAVTAANRAPLVWNTTEFRAKADLGGPQTIESGFSFLDDVLYDPTEVFDGTLDIDLEISKDIDNGATVADATQELWETEPLLVGAHAELDDKDKEETDKKAAAVDETEKELALQEQQIDKNDAALDEQEREFVLQEQKIDNKDDAVPRSSAILLDTVNTSDVLAPPSRTSTALGDDSGVLANPHAKLGEKDKDLDKRDTALEEKDEDSVFQDQTIALLQVLPAGSTNNAMAFPPRLLDMQQDAPPSQLQRGTAVPERRVQKRKHKSPPRVPAARNPFGVSTKPKVTLPSGLTHPSCEADQNESRIFKKGRSPLVPQSPLDSAGGA